MTTTTSPPTHGNLTPEAHRALVLNAVTRCRTAYRRHYRWQQACLDRDNPPSLRLLPSKTSKFTMYADAGRILRLLDAPQELAPRTLSGIAAVLAYASKCGYR